MKSASAIDLQGASECVSGYRDLYILQYDTETAAKNAYAYYADCPAVDYVEPDYIRIMQDETADSQTETEIGAEELLYTVRDAAQSWVSEQIGFEAIKLRLAEMQMPEIVVAVLDSGADTDHELLEGRLLGTVLISAVRARKTAVRTITATARMSRAFWRTTRLAM